MSLREPESATLQTRGPFHLEATVRVLQRRPTHLADRYEGASYLRVLPTASGPVLVRVDNRGSLEDPDLHLRILCGPRTEAARATLVRTLRKVLGLDVDPRGLEALARADARLAPTVAALRGMRPPRFPELFEAFASVIPFQQLSLHAGVSIVGRMLTRFGPALEFEGRQFRAFPGAAVIADCALAQLKECGLTARKAQSLRDIAKLIGSGQLSEQALASQSSADAIQSLRELPGIGPWSASLVLLRGLGRLDVFPPSDVGATRGLRALLNMPASEPLDPVVQRAGDLRGYLYFCALGSSLLAQGLITRAR